MVATSFQAVSGAGVSGIEDLRQQTLAWSRGEAMVARHFAHPIAFNLLPAGDIGANGYTGEEMKLIDETRKILEAPDLLVAPTTVRVPVFTCHSIAVNAETEERVSATEARRLFERFPGSPGLGRPGGEPLSHARPRGGTGRLLRGANP